MSVYNRKDIFSEMIRTGMIPVFYNGEVEISKAVMRACYDGGVRVFEFTNRGERALEVFKELSHMASTLPGLILGAGSISFARDAWKFISHGAEFIVGPQYVPSVNMVCRLRGIPYIPGCGTVSEVGRAQRHGCTICKVFPGDVLTPSFVKGLMAPMPWSRIMVTGGVKPEEENLRKWFACGVCCVGMGSNLFPKQAIDSSDFCQITSLCRNALEIIARVRGVSL